MPVVSLVLEVRLDGCATAKKRRAESSAILARLRSHFNVSGCDLSREDAPEVAALGFAAVGRTRREARDLLENVAEAVAAHPRAEILKAAFDEI